MRVYFGGKCVLRVKGFLTADLSCAPILGGSAPPPCIKQCGENSIPHIYLQKKGDTFYNTLSEDISGNNSLITVVGMWGQFTFLIGEERSW